MHPSDGELLLSIEPSSVVESSEVRSHRATCTRCAARVDVLLGEMAAAAESLTALDVAVPKPDVRALIERAKRSVPAEATSPTRRFPARAAAIGALLVLAGAAAAFPGSPMRRWLTRQSSETNPTAPPLQVAPVPEGFAGIALPADAPLEIVLPTNVRSGTLLLTGAGDPMVRVRSSDPTTAFSLGPGLLTLDTTASTLELEVASPAGLPRLVVRVGARVVLDRVQPFAAGVLPLGDTLRIDLAGG